MTMCARVIMMKLIEDTPFPAGFTTIIMMTKISTDSRTRPSLSHGHLMYKSNSAVCTQTTIRLYFAGVCFRYFGEFGGVREIRHF